jgi:uncharacterized membrane protein
MELGLAKKGLWWGIISGAAWGLQGAFLGAAVAMAPFTAGASLYGAPLASAALEEGWAGFFMFWYNLFTGRFMEYGRTIRTKAGLLVCCGAMFGGPLSMSFYLIAVTLCGAAYSLAITGIYPAIGAIVAMLWFKERISARAWTGIILCVIGAFLVGYTAPSGQFPHFYSGILLSIIPAFGWAFEGVFATFGSDMVDPDVAVGIREAVSFFVYLLAILPIFAGLLLFGQAFSHVSLWWLAMAGAAGAVSYITFYRALNTTGVGRGCALNITYAMFGVFFSWLLLPQQITTTLIIGCVIIVLGAVLIMANPLELLKLRAD